MIDILEDDSTSGAPRLLMDQPGPQRLVVVDWAAATKQGSQRLLNEDSWAQIGPIFVVADGMGGLDAGHTASKMAAQSLVSEWFSSDDKNPVEVVHRVNDAVRKALAGVDSGGSTMSALRIANDQATVVHVGDSRVYRVRGDHAELLSRDQNLRAELMAAGIVPKSSQVYGPLRALTSYMGMASEDLRVDVRSVALRAGDLLVMCTDGVFHDVNLTDFTGIVQGRGHERAKAIAVDLVSGVRPDDATAIVIKIGTADRQQGTLS